MKLCKTDMIVLGEGRQCKKAIEQVFGSVEMFAETFPELYTVNSLKQYLRSYYIDNINFPQKMEYAFKKPYKEICKRFYEQVESYLQQIEAEINLYDNAEDLDTVDYLVELAEIHDKDLIPYCFYIKALIYINIGLSEKAIDILKIVSQDSELKNKANSEIGFCYFLEKQYVEAEQYYKLVLQEQQEFLILYRYGILLNNVNRNMQAIYTLQKAMQATEDNYRKGNALMNIAIANKRIAQYNKAIELLHDCIDLFQSPHDKAMIYENMADIYLLLGNYHSANKYIQLSINGIDKKRIRDYFIVIKTLTAIEFKSTNKSDYLISLIEYIKELEKNPIYKIYVTQGIELIMKYADSKQLEILIELLTYMENSKSYVFIKHEVKSYLYDINKKKGMI